MTPQQLKSARLALGLSARKMAIALDIPGEWGERTVRKWESGAIKTIPDWVVEKVKEMGGS